MLNISENITVTGNVTIDNKIIINMAATVVIEENTYPNISITVLDKNTFKDNFDTCKQGVLEFTERVLNKEYEALGGIINEVE